MGYEVNMSIVLDSDYDRLRTLYNDIDCLFKKKKVQTPVMDISIYYRNSTNTQPDSWKIVRKITPLMFHIRFLVVL